MNLIRLIYEIKTRMKNHSEHQEEIHFNNWNMDLDEIIEELGE
jgi:hypothetical protein